MKDLWRVSMGKGHDETLFPDPGRSVCVFYSKQSEGIPLEPDLAAVTMASSLWLLLFVTSVAISTVARPRSC